MEKIKVLFLASNPGSTTSLQLDEEIRAITQKIRAAEHRDSLQLISSWAVRTDDLLQLLNEHKPHIIHFSGHGNREGDIILVDNNGDSKAVSKLAIKALLKSTNDNVRMVIFNACYSDKLAQECVKEIDCAIGMSNEIGDIAAITFAASFYRAIGFNRSVQQAFQQATAALLLEGIPENETPVLITKKGVNPSELFLIGQLEICREPIQDKIEELISILNTRADIITRTLSKYFQYTEVKIYLDQFVSLHQQHVAALQKGYIIHAHEILTQIYKLSYNLEKDEFWKRHAIETPDLCYKLCSDAFQNGIIICGYIAGDMERYSPECPQINAFAANRSAKDEIQKIYDYIVSS